MVFIEGNQLLCNPENLRAEISNFFFFIFMNEKLYIQNECEDHLHFHYYMYTFLVTTTYNLFIQVQHDVLN